MTLTESAVGFIGTALGRSGGILAECLWGLPTVNFWISSDWIWRIGSDDFVLPGLVEIILRLAWLVLVVLLFVQHEHVPCSAGSGKLRIYLAGVLVMLMTVLVTTTVLVGISARGSVMEVDARSAVATVLTLRVVLALPEVCWNLMGTVWIFTGSINCSDHAPLWMLLKGLLVVTWVALFVLLLTIVLLFEPMHRPDYSADQADVAGSTYTLDANMGSHYIQLWERRCRLLCCASSKDETSLEALRNVADVLASIFEDNELVASDIAAALVLLRLKQKYQEKREKRESAQRVLERTSQQALEEAQDLEVDAVVVDVEVESTLQRTPHAASACGGQSDVNIPLGSSVNDEDDGSLVTLRTDPNGRDVGGVVRGSSPARVPPLALGGSPDTPPFSLPNPCSAAPPPHLWMTVANAHHFMKFALASYGWPWFVYGHCCSSFASMWQFFKCCAPCCCRSVPHSVHGDNCCLCHTAAMKAITGLEDDDFCFIHYHNNIYKVPFFVAIDDASASIVVAIRGTMSLQDTITDMTAQTASVYCTASCEEGAGECLAHKGMVNAASFVYDKLQETQVLCRALFQRPNYRIVVTGHSLGAGAAVVLAARLRQDQREAQRAGVEWTGAPLLPQPAPHRNGGGRAGDEGNRRGEKGCGEQAEPKEDKETSSAPELGENDTKQPGEENRNSGVENSSYVKSNLSQSDMIAKEGGASSGNTAKYQLNGVPSNTKSDQTEDPNNSIRRRPPREIICFAYSPPGGLCSDEFASHTRDFVMSVVVGDDLVPRLSMHSLHKLRENILVVLRECGQPKYRLLAQGCWFMLFGISESSLNKGFSEVHGDSLRRRRRRRSRGRAPHDTANVEDSRSRRVSEAARSSRLGGGGRDDEQLERSGLPESGTSSPSSSQPLLWSGAAATPRNYESTENISDCLSITSDAIIMSTGGGQAPGAPRDSDSPQQQRAQHTPRHTETTLCLPGYVLTVRPASVKTPERWRVQWRRPCEFSELVISPWMMRHHLPQEVMKALDYVMDNGVTVRGNTGQQDGVDFVLRPT